MLRGLGCDDRSLAQGSMGITTGDFDRDGDLDLYVTNFDLEYNTFHEQRESGLWLDQTSKLGLSTPTTPLVGFGTEAVDLDHDGSLELIVSNGHVDMFSRADERSVYAHPMQIFRRNASQSYDSIAGELAGEYLANPHVGRALWTLDADRDGRTDFAVTHQTEPVALLMNRSQSGDWLGLRLIGRNCSRDAIGARVEVTLGDQRWTAAQTSGDGYLCSNERILRIGLGDVESEACDVKVIWPDGTVQVYRQLDANTMWTLIESDPEAFRDP